jgi:Uma2 family endonuclease
MNPPAGGFTNDENAEIISQLRIWWAKHNSGPLFDANTGFRLSDNSILSPDAAYVSAENLKG